MSRVVVLVGCLALAACGGSSPTPPEVPPGGGGNVINGTERLEWDQPAANQAELASFRYILYVDDAGVELTNVSCASSAGPSGFTCSAGLPPMPAGSHRLTLTAFVDVGTRLESQRSAPLEVVMGGRIVVASTPGVSVVTTVDGVRLRASAVVDGLEEPTALAFAPDGRIFIAERAGRIRVVRNRLQPASTLVLSDVLGTAPNGLLAIAVDPRFERNGWIYAAYTAASGFRIARFRSVGDTLAEGMILLDGIGFSSERPATSLRFGPDGKLYAAFDDADDPARAGDPGSFSGKVLRLDTDATTPSDLASGALVYAAQIASPRGLDWDPRGTLWIAEQAANGQDRLEAVAAPFSDEQQGTTVARYVLPPGTGAAGVSYYTGDAIEAFRGNLLVAADDGRALLRFRLDTGNRHAIVSTERLLADTIGRIRAIGVAPWGTIYLGTESSVMQLVPDAPSPGAGPGR